MNLRPYQSEAVAAVRNYWENGGENPLVSMATGAGKSMTQAALVKSLIADYSNLRVVCLVHVRELVEQNAMAMLRAWPGAPIGINSAGLGRRDKRAQILFASIQSIYKDDAYSLGDRDLVLIDEAHLVPKDGEGMYRTFINALRQRAPDLRIAGMTATPWRMGSGRLDKGDGRLFSEIVYEYGIGTAIADGYLCPPVSPGTETKLDVSGVKMTKGEFVQRDLEIKVDDDFITTQAVSEMVRRGKDRKSWIVFACGVDHATHVAAELIKQGIEAESVFGNTSNGDRKRIFDRFKAGKLRAVVNVGVATTGFDAPNIDMIVLLRPTLSPGLYVQMIGRGTRLFPGKENCLVLDFAGNLERHGPVDQIKVQEPREKKPKEDKPAQIPSKKCPECGSLVFIGSLDCPECGHSFAADGDDLPKHDVAPDELHQVLSTALPSWLPVNSLGVHRHDKIGSPPTMRVEYSNGLTSYREWICFEHTGFPKAKAATWWRRMGGALPIPATVDEAVSRKGELLGVEAVQVRPRGKFVDIVAVKTIGYQPQRSNLAVA